ncbi:MAG: GerAB/ArcD/ProY family transporter, partial [Clostridia bacterium]|nr:GerAB/ArcD/ProY family transporter [Clostridia bacterium]
FFSILAIVAILLSLIPRFEFLNILPPFYDGVGQVGYSLTMLTFSSMEMGAFLMLAPMVKGKITKTYIAYALVSSVFLFVVFFTIMAVLGEYATLQMFPFYGAAGVAQIGELSNLSALEASVWMIGVFLKSAVYLHLCYDCLSFFISTRHRSLAIVGLALLGVFCAVFTSNSLVTSNISYALPIVISFNGLFSVVIPVVVLIIGKLKRRNQNESKAMPAS